MDGWTFRDELQCGVVQVEVTYFRKSCTRRGEIRFRRRTVSAKWGRTVLLLLLSENLAFLQILECSAH